MKYFIATVLLFCTLRFHIDAKAVMMAAVPVKRPRVLPPMFLPSIYGKREADWVIANADGIQSDAMFDDNDDNDERDNQLIDLPIRKSGGGSTRSGGETPCCPAPEIYNHRVVLRRPPGDLPIVKRDYYYQHYGAWPPISPPVLKRGAYLLNLDQFAEDGDEDVEYVNLAKRQRPVDFDPFDGFAAASDGWRFERTQKDSPDSFPIMKRRPPGGLPIVKRDQPGDLPVWKRSGRYILQIPVEELRNAPLWEGTAFSDTPPSDLPPVRMALFSDLEKRAPPGPPIVRRGPPGFPVVRRGPPGLPVVRRGPPGLPVVRRAPAGLPIVRRGPAGLPIVRRGPAGLPIVRRGPAGLPIVRRGPAGLPIVRRGPAGLPIVRRGPAGLPIVRRGPAGLPIVKRPRWAALVDSGDLSSPPNSFPIMRRSYLDDYYAAQLLRENE